MRRTLLLAAILWAQAGCGDNAAPLPTGVLRISIATLGDDPDLDGYQLRVDNRDPVQLDPTSVIDLSLAAGSHRLDLLGVADHCSADPSTSRHVEVEADGVTIATFTIDCPLTGARISVSTGGLDRDSSGYAVDIDGVTRDSLDQSGTLVLRLEPGVRTIALTGVAENCTAEDPSRRITILAGNAATVSFAVVCTAVTGVIEAVIEADPSSIVGPFRVMVDGHSHDASSLAPTYVSVAAGPHAVALEAPGNCTVDVPSKAVTVTAGGLVRDTVGVRFSVACAFPVAGYLRATVVSIGARPRTGLSVWICDWSDEYYCRYSVHTRLGPVMPGGTLIAAVGDGYHRAWLEGLPTDCGGTTAFHPSSPFLVSGGDTVNVVLETHC
jgi:hypothetical protein